MRRLQRLLLGASCAIFASGVLAATVADVPQRTALVAGGNATVATTEPAPFPPAQASVPSTPDAPGADQAVAPTTSLPPATVPPVPTSVPTPRVPPLDLPLAEPPGVLYVQPDSRANELLQLTWSGRLVRPLTLDEPVECCGLQTSSPDGSLFRLGHRLYDANGSHLGTLHGQRWGDDNRHVCTVEAHNRGDMEGPRDLILVDMAGNERVVATLPAPDPGTGATVVACNPALDRAVVFVSNPPSRRVLVVRLSDGRVEDAPAACEHGYSVNPSGRYLVAARSPTEPATICDLDTGAVVGRLPRPGGLTGDGSRILTTEIDECGSYHTLVLSEWRTGTRLWSSADPGYRIPCDQHYAVWRFHPTTSSFALQVVTLNTRAAGPVFISDGRLKPKRVVEAARYSVVF